MFFFNNGIIQILISGVMFRALCYFSNYPMSTQAIFNEINNFLLKVVQQISF